MKRFALLLLVIVLAATACGCTLGTLKVGVSSDGTPPFAYENSARRMVGSDITLASSLASGMRRDIEIVPLSWGERQAALDSGKVDILVGGLTRETEKDAKYLTSSYQNGALYLVAPVGATDFSTQGKRVGVLKESAAYYIYGLDVQFRNELEEWSAFSRADDLFESLEKGSIDLIICDAALADHMSDTRGTDYAVSDTALCQVEYLISAKNAGMLKKIEAQLEKIG